MRKRSLQVTGMFLCFLLGSAFVFAEDRNAWQQPDKVTNDIILKPGCTVADVGCGDGYFTLKLAKALGGKGKVFAADINAGALDKLKKKAESERLSNIVTVVSDPTETKLQQKSVDVLFMCDVLHEVPEAQRIPLVKSAVRALKPGGFFYLLDYRKSRDVKFDPYDKLIPRDDLVKLCTDTGLRLDGEFHYLKYQVFLRFLKPVD